MPKSNDNWSIKDFLSGFISGGIFIILAIWMLINPQQRSNQPAKGTSNIGALILDAIWSTPGGIVIGIIGLLAIYGTLHQMMTQNKMKN